MSLNAQLLRPVVPGLLVRLISGQGSISEAMRRNLSLKLRAIVVAALGAHLKSTFPNRHVTKIIAGLLYVVTILLQLNDLEEGRAIDLNGATL